MTTHLRIDPRCLGALESIARGNAVEDHELPSIPNPSAMFLALFRKDEIRKARMLLQNSRHNQGFIASLIAEKITGPALQRINEQTAQQNDARYLAYALIHHLTRSE